MSVCVCGNYQLFVVFQFSFVEHELGELLMAIK